MDHDHMHFFTIAFSTFLGAAVALAAERLTRARDARLQEEAAVNNLILDLAAKRAFLAGDDWDWAEGELQRVVESIFHARSLIREARVALRPRSAVLPHLRLMARACNNFLELSERVDEQTLKDALRQLCVEMTTEVRAVNALRPKRILGDEPGSFALDLAS
jgi:hypothetical protein